MASIGASPSDLGSRRIAFSLVVLLTIGLAAFFGLVVLQPELFAALFGRATGGHISEHFRDPHHRIHDLTFAFLLGTAVVGMVVQLRTPLRNVAGQLMALTPFVALVLAFALTNTGVLQIPWVVLGASTLLATMLHPAGRDLFRSVSVARVDRVMLALVVIAAGPLLAFAFSNLALQRAGLTDHAVLGHYGFLAAFGFTVIGVGVLANLRPHGWRLTAWVAGFHPALLGVASVVVPDVDSSLGLGWALAAVAWGVVFVAAAERASRRSENTQIVDVPPDRGSTTGMPGSAYVVGIAVIALVLVFVLQHLIGGGLGGMHTPPAP